MRVYLAARFDRRDELRGYACELEASGKFVVQARWVKTDDHEVDDAALNDPNSSFAARIAQDDLDDIRESDALIYFSGGGGIRGGRFVEYGFALALGKQVFICGPRENVFAALRQVKVYDTWEDLKEGWYI